MRAIPKAVPEEQRTAQPFPTQINVPLYPDAPAPVMVRAAPVQEEPAVQITAFLDVFPSVSTIQGLQTLHAHPTFVPPAAQHHVQAALSVQI